MNPEAQRIEIAKACGWGLPYQDGVAYRPLSNAPDYLNDLNAMHEAEGMLIFSNRKRFRAVLQKVMSRGMDGICLVAIEECIHATAAQRAEAFTRTIEKWDSENSDYPTGKR